MNDLEIIDYLPEHQPYFKSLNTAWIEKYFTLEEIDKQVLNQPEQYIYKQDGTIIMASYKNQIVGTVALKRIDASTFEMTKMAVDEQFRGYNIGYHLGVAIIEKAKELGAERLVLYSQTNLVPAIGLYNKLGFKEVDLEPGTYKRCNIKMEIVFKTQQYLHTLSNQLKDTIEEYLIKFRAMDENVWKVKPDLKKWSKKEILGHLIDSAANNHQRFVRAQYTQNLEFPKYEQDDWVFLQHYQHTSAAHLIDLWYAYNRHLAEVIRNIRYDKTEARVTIGNNPPVTLAFLVEDYISHLKHHLKRLA